MAKLVLKGGKEGDRIKKALMQSHSCYVLITCSKPSVDGDMDVELSYEGDTMLVSYLVDSASAILSEQESESLNG